MIFVTLVFFSWQIGYIYLEFFRQDFFIKKEFLENRSKDYEKNLNINYILRGGCYFIQNL